MSSHSESVLTTRDYNEKQAKEAEEREFEEQFKKLSVRQQKKVLREKENEKDGENPTAKKKKKPKKGEEDEDSFEDTDEDDSEEEDEEAEDGTATEDEAPAKLETLPKPEAVKGTAQVESEETDASEEDSESSEDATPHSVRPKNNCNDQADDSDSSLNEDEDIQLYCDLKKNKIQVETLEGPEKLVLPTVIGKYRS
jgi:hypothetical protein